MASLGEPGILRALVNPVIVTAFAVGIGLAFGTPVACGIARSPFTGRKHVWFWYFAHWMLVPVGILIPFYMTASNVGFVTLPLVLILVYQVLTILPIVWLLVDQFRSVPIVLEEAAIT